MATLFVGAGGFATIQEAIDAANEGDTIIIAAGTYNESPVVDKALTIQGAQAGVPGTTRNPSDGAGETNITGEVSITATGDVTIDGVRIVNDEIGGDPSLDVISTGTNGHTFTNSIIFSTVQGGNQGDLAIAVRPGSTGTVNITDNAISGAFPNAFSTASFQSGIFFDGGGRDLVVTGNLFEFTRAGLNLDIAGDSEVTVSDNTFRTAGTAFAVSLNADGLTATDNDLQQVGTDFSFRNTTTGVTFDAGAAIDTLTPVGNGNDLVVVLGGSGEDTLIGSEFADVIDGNNNPAFLVNNVPTGTDTDADTLTGLGGDDQLFGRGGDDDLDGGAGRDTVNGNQGDDIIRSSSGVDFVFGDAGTDTLIVDYSASTSGVFVDESRLAFGTDPAVEGGTQGEFSNGVDSSVDFRSIEIFDVTTGSGNDSIRTGAGNDRIVLNAGDDTADAGAGNDTVDGGAGNDTLTLASGGDDTVIGGDGNDFLFFGDAFTNGDNVDGGTGIDSVGLLGNYNMTFDANDLVGVENLFLFAGNRIDPNGSAVDYNLTTVDANVGPEGLFVTAATLRADESLTFIGSAETDGAFRVVSGAGEDILVGGAKGDFFQGGAGNDRLFGLDGNDTLVGGTGTDQLRGGFGRDTFRFDSVADSTPEAPDFIADFNRGEDKIDLSGIDANESQDGDQAFTYIGDASFSGQAGELRSVFDSETGQSRVEGDTDGDMLADFAVQVFVFGQPPLVATDFIL